MEENATGVPRPKETVSSPRATVGPYAESPYKSRKRESERERERGRKVERERENNTDRER